ncbi:alpha/beta fold hydrolase [Arthrobacter sp. ISL-72]|uniref:alpha/beta fold hydrolase n=1 Tax=Arthrobacter sp. ISL-72 TaxID=2819114 RepID=UPI002034D5C6|nr:alpha/beta hydrolase [Arthrobacter sp. ISL-72]
MPSRRRATAAPTPPAAPLTAENSAGDTLAVLEQLAMETVDVLGFSAGGHTAVALALGRPASVRRLIIASTFVSRDAVPDEFWEGMSKATLADMPDTYKDADRLLNPAPAIWSCFSSWTAGASWTSPAGPTTSWARSRRQRWWWSGTGTLSPPNMPRGWLAGSRAPGS